MYDLVETPSTLRDRFELFLRRLFPWRRPRPTSSERAQRTAQNAWEIGDRRRSEKRRAELKAELENKLKSDYLGVDAFYRAACTSYITEEEFDAARMSFLRSWFERPPAHSDPLDIEYYPPNDEQLRAIGSVEGNIQMVARAGSGKTTTVANRAYFLHAHCGVPLDEMLLVAFNKKAAEEISKKLRNLVGREPPYVMTFHALAYAIVHPGPALLIDGPDNEALSDEIKKSLDNQLAEPGFLAEVRKMMVDFVRTPAEAEPPPKERMSKEEYLAFRRSEAFLTLRGEYVKSGGEALLANFFFEHSIKYEYERNVYWNGVNYRPDFTLPLGERKVIIEYFGMQGDPDYDAMSAAKRRFWTNHPEVAFLEYSRHDLAINGPERFKERLRADLVTAGVPCARRSDESIWKEVKDRLIEEFHRGAGQFLSRCRKKGWSVEDLDQKLKQHKPLDAIEMVFLRLCQGLYSVYLARLEKTGQEDFDGLLIQAAERVSAGATVFKRKSGEGDLKQIQWLFIDEFQDFSPLFHNFVSAIKDRNPELRLFCVGDDWQAINGFAGSELRFFQNFALDHAPAQVLELATNYRSSAEIVDLGNRLMLGRGEPARAHRNEPATIYVCDLDGFTQSLDEKVKFGDQVLITVVVRLVREVVQAGEEVVLLARRNSLPGSLSTTKSGGPNRIPLKAFLEQVRDCLPEAERDWVSAMTAHKSKGTEAETVIVLDAEESSYPFIHPSWTLFRLFGDNQATLTDAERRLFYVALTRAKRRLYIITNRPRVSPFLAELEKSENLERREWTNYHSEVAAVPNPALDGTFGVRVTDLPGKPGAGTYSIREQLKGDGYRWDAPSKTWYKRYQDQQLSVTELRLTDWGRAADGVEVVIVTGSGIIKARHTVRQGDWQAADGQPGAGAKKSS